MIKTVNVFTRIPIRNVKPPLQGNYKNIKMHTSDIVKCLNRRARVEEVLSDGTKILLNLSNYYKDHSDLINTTKTENESPHQATINKMENKEDNSNAITEQELNSANVIVMKETKEEITESEIPDTITEENLENTDNIEKTEAMNENDEVKEETKHQEPATSSKNNKVNIKNKK